MTELRQVVGVFRDRGQKPSRRASVTPSVNVPLPDALAEDTAGVHVILRITGAPDDACHLLLDYGAYSASIS
jgi:hypothetical protein